MRAFASSWLLAAATGLVPIFVGAAPAHYLVLEIGEDALAHPLYYSKVELAPDAGHAVPVLPSRASDAITWRSIGPRGAGALSTISMPQVLHAEFARDPDSATSAIDSLAVPNEQRSFVVRAPVADGDAIELLLASGATQHIDVAAIAANAARLPLAGHVPEVAAPAMRGGNPGNRLDILVFGDGYTAGEQGLFETHAQTLRDSMFDITPYREYESYVNWVPAFVASAQSGSTHPPYQAGCTTNACCSDTAAQTDPLAGQVRATAFQSRFCAFQIHRLLVANNGLVLAAAASIPDWDVILVSVNDPVYGGSGGQIGVMSQHGAAVEVTIHEFGHTFTGLADEYDSPYPGYPTCSDTGGGPACEANVTNQTLAAAVKWRDLFSPGISIPTPPGTPGTGLFEGARYFTTGMYRPANQCEMRQLGVEFCAVCRQEYVKHLYRGGWGAPAGGIDPIEPGSESPAIGAPVAVEVGTDQAFGATLLQPSIGTHDVGWWLDGVPIAGADQATYVFSQAATTPALHTLELRVSDPTALVIPSMADGLLVSSRSWTIEVVEADVIFADGFEAP